MAQVSMSVRMDEGLKASYDALCSQMGISANKAMNGLARYFVINRRMPSEGLASDNSTRQRGIEAFRAIRKMAEAGELPDLTFQRGFDVLKGRKYVTSDVACIVGGNVGSLSVVQLSERQRKICELIKDNAYISSKQMSEVLSVVRRTVERDLATLQKMEVLLREGNTSAGRWVLLKKKLC